jgi:hypothetical protein
MGRGVRRRTARSVTCVGPFPLSMHAWPGFFEPTLGSRGRSGQLPGPLWDPIRLALWLSVAREHGYPWSAPDTRGPAREP